MKIRTFRLREYVCTRCGAKTNPGGYTIWDVWKDFERAGWQFRHNRKTGQDEILCGSCLRNEPYSDFCRANGLDEKGNPHWKGFAVVSRKTGNIVSRLNTKERADRHCAHLCAHGDTQCFVREDEY